MSENFSELIKDALENIGISVEKGDTNHDEDGGWIVITLPDTRRYFVEYCRTHLNGPHNPEALKN